VSVAGGAEASDQQLGELLRKARVIAVVGLSSKKWRASFGVSEFLQSVGYRIIPVNPRETEVLGEKSYARLEDIPEKPDIVDVFRRSEAVPEIVDAAIAIGAKSVWMQEGVAHEAAADRCILREHHRLLK
jgi:predicted CoA-binding protein